MINMTNNSFNYSTNSLIFQPFQRYDGKRITLDCKCKGWFIKTKIRLFQLG